MQYVITMLNKDYTLHKSIYTATSYSHAYQQWVSEYGDVEFLGNININLLNKI